MSGEVDHRPDLRLAAALGGVVLLWAAGPAIWAWQVRDRLPGEVARHWGSGGAVTGTWSLGTQLVALGTITLLAAAACGAFAVLGRQPLMVRRLLAGCAVWTASVLGASQVAAIGGQLDLDDPFAAPDPGAGLAVGAVLGLLLGALVALLAREPAHGSQAPGPPPDALPRLPSGEATSWRATPPPSRGLVAVAVLTLVVLGVAAAAGGWWALILGATIVVPMLAMARFRVEVDHRGLVVATRFATLVHVPLEQVAGATVIDHLDPFWEFGGWGLRVDVHGRTGLVSRAGEALAVTRADGSELVVTVDDAAVAAATLNTLADRHHAS